jgi:hypothetical protein
LKPEELIKWSYDCTTIEKISESEYVINSDNDEILYRIFKISEFEKELGTNSIAFFCKREEFYFFGID